MKVWLTPEEAKVDTKDKWNIPTIIRMRQFDTVFKELKGIDIKVGEPFINNIECITFNYIILYLRNAKYDFIYVLEGFEDWVLDSFKLREKNK